MYNLTAFTNNSYKDFEEDVITRNSKECMIKWLARLSGVEEEGLRVKEYIDCMIAYLTGRQDFLLDADLISELVQLAFMAGYSNGIQEGLGAMSKEVETLAYTMIERKELDSQLEDERTP